MFLKSPDEEEVEVFLVKYGSVHEKKRHCPPPNEVDDDEDGVGEWEDDSKRVVEVA